jgi:sugar fermentation stimulation protein A
LSARRRARPARRFRPFPADRLRRATFVERPNRFVVVCRLEGGESVGAYLPNPGRLRELLLPGAALTLLEHSPPAAGVAKLGFTAVAVAREGRPVMLHTHRTNDAARHLIEAGRVPGLETARVVAAEHRVGRSRFDFLLEHDGAPLLLEVKSCTQFGRRVAMFPDAVTARGARHVRELAELARGGARTAVLFVVQWPEAELFLPDYHTDLGFARALLEARDAVQVIALGVGWAPDLSLEPAARALAIPWPLIEREARDRGSYLLLLELGEAAAIDVGGLGRVRFAPGFYVYVGSAMASLGPRIERHRRRRKRFHWHVDVLRDRAAFVEALPIRAADRLECELAAAVRDLAGWAVPGFGSSDCGCGGHLFGFAADPRRQASFQALLQRFRMDRLEALAYSKV